MKKILSVIVYISLFYANLQAFCSNGTIQEVVGAIKNGNFDSAGDGWATGWRVEDSLNPSDTYAADGDYVFLWDDNNITQTINIQPNTEYQIRFLGAYSVKKNGMSDEKDSRYKGQAVRFTYSNGNSVTKNVTHWIFYKKSYYKALAPYSVDLGNSGSSTKLTIKGCAGGCSNPTSKDTFIKLDAFKLYKCVPNSTNPNPKPNPQPKPKPKPDEPQKISIKKRIKLTIYNDDVKFLAKDNGSQLLKTKIVKESFKLSIHSVDENKKDITNKVASDVKVRLISSDKICTSNSVAGLTNWQSLDMANKESSLASFVSSVANRNVKVQVKWKNIRSESIVECCSVDNFAIRPKKFELTLPSSYVKAGEKFRVKILAKDQKDGASANYNATNSSFDIIYKDKKSSCNTGTLTFKKTKFTNGVFDDSEVTYDDVGELEITIQERKGSEFAVVDAGDTAQKDRFIEPATATQSFVPSELDTTIILTDAKSDITFYAHDPLKMASNMHYDLKATTKSGTIVSNYKDGCYAKDVSLKIYYTNSNTSDIQTVVSDQNITDRGVGYFKFVIDKSSFASTGKTSDDVKINLDRDKKVAKNPNLFTIKKVEASDGFTTTIKNISTNNEAHFYYGRAHVPSPQTSDTNIIKAKVYYEVYCKGCDKAKFTQANGKSSEDSVYWYVLSDGKIAQFTTAVCNYKDTASDLYAADVSTVSTVSHEDFETIKVEASKIPSKNKIFYEPISEFLQYNKFGTALPKHYFSVIFSTKNRKWAGEGEKGETVDLNVSRKSNQSLDW